MGITCFSVVGVVLVVAVLRPIVVADNFFLSIIGDKAKRVRRRRESCDLYEGRWVYDNSYPLYNQADCPFIEQEFDCIGNGRPDTAYLKYRWQPSGCDLPRFDGVDFLERQRGKRVMFVGDSISLNHWQSLACMLHSAVPRAEYNLTRMSDISTFTFPRYNASLMFSRNAYLVAIEREKVGTVLKLNAINQVQQPTLFVQRRLLITTGHEWKDSKAKTCEGQTRPLLGPKYPGSKHPAESVVEKVIRRMTKPVHLLKVTRLSQLRKDGHPSVYGRGGRQFVDCSHWCLAGVPDTWNQLLYANLLE
ncbi:trichome birefringence-like 41-like protein [Drosera capensis]